MICNLQALRGLSALLVVLVHLSGPLRPIGDFRSVLGFGSAGVDLFFVISGFVMVYTTSLRPVTAKTFLLHRIIRVVPLYWGATLALFALAALAPSLVQATRSEPSELLQSLLFVPFVRSDGQLAPLFFLGWTLNYEMAFYLLYATMLWMARGRVGVTVALSSGMIAAVVAAGAAFDPRSPALGFYSNPIVAEFALGMLLGWWFTRGGALNLPMSAATFASGMALLLTYPLLAIPNHAPPLYAAAAAVVAGAVSLERRGLVISSRPVQLVGAASYALYLSHPFVMQAAAWVAGNLNHAAAAVVALASVPLALLVAVAVHLMAEKPVTSFLRNLAERGAAPKRRRGFGEARI